MNLTGRLSEALLAGQRMSHADFWSETVEVAKRLDVDGPKLIRRGGLDLVPSQRFLQPRRKALKEITHL